LELSLPYIYIMKKILSLLLILTPFLIQAQQSQIEWISVEEAAELMKNEPRKIMMDVYTEWCGPCKMMMKNTFSNADVISFVNANYYAVKFNAESPDPIQFKNQPFENPDYDPARKGRNGVHQFARYMRVNAYPTIVYLDEDLNFLTGDAGYKTATQIELMLKFFAQDDYKKVSTQEEWDAYQTNFKPSFKE
jgi:thioredoxin-related protein